jgi:NAD(P)-dependent dehydrogenase (short-subunit alcohol dehydrogenase family)
LSRVALISSYLNPCYFVNSKFAVEGLTEALAKELKPEWNIKITIVQPGSFATDFGAAIAVAEQHPAYEGSPATAIRGIIQNPSSWPRGDPVRAVQAIFKVAQASEPPLKLPLGQDAVNGVLGQLERIQTELDQWKWLSTSTNDS